MYICICNAVTESEIRGAVALGSKSVADLREGLGVGTCCGKCVPEAHKLLKSCAQECQQHDRSQHRRAAGD